MKPLYFLMKHSKRRHFIYSLLQSLILFLVMVGCSLDKTEDGILPVQTEEEPNTKGAVGETGIPANHQIVLGEEIPDVYSVEAMREAYRQLYPNGDGQHGPNAIQITHQYVRFLPKSDEEYESIMKYDLSDIPLHLEITQGGSSYHDPTIPEDQYTWQYAVIPIGQLNTTVEYEILKELCFPPDETNSSETGMPGAAGPSGGGESMSFWETLEAASERIANGQAITQEVREGLQGPPASKWRPWGFLTVYDDLLKTNIPLEGVHIKIWRNKLRSSKVVTGKNGRFYADELFEEGCGLYYEIQWTGGADFIIYDGPHFNKAYLVGGMVWGPWQAVINKTDYLQKHLASMFRAGERMYRKDYLGMTPADMNGQIVMRYIDGANSDKSAGTFRGQFVVNKIDPAIKIWGTSFYTGNKFDSFDIFSTTTHELGHANHYYQMPKPRAGQFDDISKIVKESWADAVQYYITKKEYQDFNKNIDSYETLAPYTPIDGEPGIPYSMGMPGAPGSITYVSPTDLNKQYWPFENLFIRKKKTENLEYSSLIIDLIDDNNQREYYKRLKTPKYITLPNDQVKGFTLAEIQSVLRNVETVEDLRIKIKELNTLLHPNLNTDTQIDNLFNSHTKYW